MSGEESTTSLRLFFRRQAFRWSLVGLGLTSIIAIGCILYSEKLAAERQIITVAKAATRAFRPLILQGSERDVELQMPKALELREGENAVIRDTKFNAVYPIKDDDKVARCTSPKGFCWSKFFSTISTAYPIYFGSTESSTLYGYLEITLKPVIDWHLISVFALLALFAFITQAIGLSTALSRSADMVTNRVAQWANHIRNGLTSADSNTIAAAPFSEFIEMQKAVAGLQDEINRLEMQAAKDAKAGAQLAILREIGHELRTPLSQLGKYWALHLDSYRSTGKMLEDEVSGIERAMKRMSDIIRQTRILHQVQIDSSSDKERQDLILETKRIVADLAIDSEVVQKKAKFYVRVSDDVPPSNISKIGYYQILENLVRNAVYAVSKDTGEVSVILTNCNGRAELCVSDNGCGIAPDIQSRIFDLDFTTKEARGTGLGLGIVKRLAVNFGADIRFTSSVGKGTQFFITFQSEHFNKEENYAIPNLSC